MPSLFGSNPYGTLGPSPSRAMIINRSGPPKEKYATFKNAQAAKREGGNPADVIKLLANQKLAFLQGKGYYAAPKGPPPRGGPKVKAKAGGGARVGAGGTGYEDYTMQQFIDLLRKPQQTALDALLADSKRRTQGEMASLAGFGAALQGYSHDLWGQTDAGYRNAAAAQQSIAQGLGGQVGSGVAEMHAQEAALAGMTGYTGGTPLASADAAAKQVASEGGAETGAMMGQVGTAWGGYGATQPEYIGFMTGQNQMQLAREQIEADKDLKSKFLELGMDNPATAMDMWSKVQENKRQDLSTSLAAQTLRSNITMQKAKLKQSWAEARLRATTQAQKLAVDARYKAAQTALDQQSIAIDQQNANSRGVTAAASASRAETAASTAAWKQAHPNVPKPTGFATGSYQQKVGRAMESVDALLKEIPQKKGSLDAVFATLWPQIEPYVSAANKELAKKLLRKRIGTKVAYWTPTKVVGSSAGGFGSLPSAAPPST